MKILIIGSGISAKEAYKLAIRQGDIPTLLISENEKCAVTDFKYIFNDQLSNDLDKYEIFIISPGVYYDDPRLILLKENNKIIISEIEYAYSKLKEYPFIIAVTGSNGKTSIVEHIYFVLNKLGLSVYKGGNIGTAFSSFVDKLSKDDILVLELSNFQLDYLKELKPQISIITNITPNHLDRVKSYADYINSKLNIYKNMDGNGHLLINDKIKNVTNFMGKIHIIQENNNHLVTNYMFVKKVLELMNIENNKLINEFNGVKYRCQKLNNLVYNDGKSTTPTSTYNAIMLINNIKNTVLIIGGRNKNLDFSKILELNLKNIIVYGELANELELEKLIKVSTLKDALNEYDRLKDNKSILLYSPGCTSFDQYNNYIERCEEFEKIVKERKYV